MRELTATVTPEQDRANAYSDLEVIHANFAILFHELPEKRELIAPVLLQLIKGEQSFLKHHTV